MTGLGFLGTGGTALPLEYVNPNIDLFSLIPAT